MDNQLDLRAWDNDSDQMIYDFGLTPEYIPYQIPSDGSSEDPANYTYYDSAQIMRWTGFTDKQGKKIYEGDIVRYMDVMRVFGASKELQPVVGVDRNFTVIYENGAFTFDNFRTTFWNEIRNARDIPDWDFPKLLEVIGNIYENPDLVEINGRIEGVNG